MCKIIVNGFVVEDTGTSLQNANMVRPLAIEDHFDLVGSLVHGIAQTFGHKCEVILHDFRDPTHSIVAISGNITHRHAGGSATEIELSAIANGDAAQDQIGYITRISDGRVVKSSTLILRDTDGHVVGALCINYDITDLRLLLSTLGELAGSPSEPSQSISFTDDIGQVIRDVIDEEEIALGCPIDRMTRQDRLSVMRAVDRRGIFALQRSVPQVAEYLGISRATVYSYLDEIRASTVQADFMQSSPPPQGL